MSNPSASTSNSSNVGDPQVSPMPLVDEPPRKKLRSNSDTVESLREKRGENSSSSSKISPNSQQQQQDFGRCVVDSLPEELLLRIFSFLLEGDLCRASIVCRTFYRIANDIEIWYVYIGTIFLV